MNQHTPGPWISDATYHNYHNHVIRHNGVIIGIIPHVTTMPDDEKWANARLIARAPEMVELVRRLAYGSNQPFDHPDARAMHKAGTVALALLREIEGEAI